MIDSALSLAISVQAAPGVFALLIGSGVSRSASILTGWEITLDLARRVAAGLGEDPEPDPAEWFGKRFGVEPAYSELLRELSKSAAIRSRLLQGYFEPSSDELAEGIKSPTPAHKAVAALQLAGTFA